MGTISKNLLKATLDLLFPPRCLGCRQRDIWLCADCISTFPRVEAPTCSICGHPTGGTAVCSRCYSSPLRIQGIRAPFFFEGILRKAIHRFKYRGATHLAEPLATILGDYLRTDAIEFDVIVPVPLHETRTKERGYNQSELLAVELGRAVNKEVIRSKLIRIRATKAQMRLPANERPGNVRDAFLCIDKELAGHRVLIIDDVCTTGSTLEACSIALKRSGVKRTWGLCLARVRLDHSNRLHCRH